MNYKNHLTNVQAVVADLTAEKKPTLVISLAKKLEAALVREAKNDAVKQTEKNLALPVDK